MLRLLPLVLLLAACQSTIYSDHDLARDFCSDLGHKGEAHARCVERRQREADCRNFVNSRAYTPAAARARNCE